MAGGSAEFYDDLDAFTDARDVCDPRHFVDAPADWWVAVADVRGSTDAIEQGRYRDVNLVGAACITAALNVSGGIGLPYVFGGDGATILYPDVLAGAIRDALLGVQATARTGFGLELRVGAITVSELVARGAPVRVAKREISEHVSLAMLGGGGPGVAEELIKTDPARLWTAETPPEPNLAGLECRWEPLASQRGHMVSGLVRVLPAPGRDVGATYRAVIDELERIAGTYEELNPAQPANLRVSLSPKRLAAETTMRAKQGAAAVVRKTGVLVAAALGRAVMKLGVKMGGTDWSIYPRDVARHTDYWKYDETLRFVIDVGADARRAIEEALTRREAVGELTFGLHASLTAVMTCMVITRGSEHVHFVDGSDGGYAMAAKQLKAKKRA